MVPGSLRTLSVVSLLCAVSGAVLVANDHHAAPATAATAGGAASLELTGALVPIAWEQAADRIPDQPSGIEVARSEHRAILASAATARALAQAKAAAAAARRAAAARVASRAAARDPKTLAKLMLADHGWSASQFSCLLPLWNKESRWNLRAANPSSGAYGIPQALPGSKMASAGADWRTNPATQIRWGLNYIAARYGTPCGAWGHSQATGWY